MLTSLWMYAEGRLQQMVNALGHIGIYAGVQVGEHQLLPSKVFLVCDTVKHALIGLPPLIAGTGLYKLAL